ncbi:hypothetical protein HG537_0D05580 [Torulaspora globosa]|uniref:Uncharacterized protein n=1 Tax=Torulaspora globosa TaxID=48254 RepID=A0A7H9HUX7_9SACH|nr:hypothetical protein HG537_0D05580 [Torulaspora sp. CBS 2947]
MTINEHPEQQLEQYIALFLTKLVRIIQIIIPLMAKFSKDHPNVFLFFASALVVYVTWRILCNMMIIIKRLFTVFVILGISFLFLRGFNQVFYSDIPLFYRIITQNQDFELVLTKWTTYLGETSFDHCNVVLGLIKTRIKALFQLIQARTTTARWD